MQIKHIYVLIHIRIKGELAVLLDCFNFSDFGLLLSDLEGFPNMHFCICKKSAIMS